eukprot:765774-Hanusia_phi.AAC.3
MSSSISLNSSHFQDVCKRHNDVVEGIYSLEELKAEWPFVCFPVTCGPDQAPEVSCPFLVD